MQIGFIGTGNMGAAIAANLVRAGHDVAVWNRTAAKTQSLVKLGAALADSPKAAAVGREVVFTMLAEDAALDAVMEGDDGLLAGLGKNTLHVSMSTIAVTTADRVDALHRHAGQRFMCAPVFGRPEAAVAAKLFIVAGGDAGDLEKSRLLFGAIGQRVFHVSETPSAASLVKLCGNFMILAAIEALGEAMTLAEKGGIAKKQLLEILTGTLFDSPVYKNYGALLAEGRFKPAGFAAPLGLKDMRLVAMSSESLRVPMPVLNVLRDHLLQTIAQQGEEVDWSAIGGTVSRNAGS